MEYSLEGAMGNWVFLEPQEKGSVLTGPETASVFKVIAGDIFEPGLVIVAPHSVVETRMGSQKMYYCHKEAILGIVRLQS